ncbi:MAG: YggT family protein [Candidatus Carbobacillus sp.]|nr:YggT family protein [Candidatus Carbobacillus sp.]
MTIFQVAQTIMTIGQYAVQIYLVFMILYILSSWIPPLYNSRLVQFIASLVEPYLGIFRRFIPPIGMLDFSPIVAFLVYNYIVAPAFLAGLSTLLNALLRLAP